MSARALACEVNRWAKNRPVLGAHLESDVWAMSEFVRTGERLLMDMGPKAERDGLAGQSTERVLELCRSVRNEFVSMHAERVYDELTDHGCIYLSLSDLVHAGASRFPGLLPAQLLIEAEGRLAQRDKDGLEIDQGIFVRGLLRSPVAGSHLLSAMRLPSPKALELLDRFRRDGSVDLSTLLVERKETVAHLTLHNVHSLNAEDNQLVEDMETAVDLALLDDQVHVGVLRGAVMTHPRYRGRRVFSAGINLRDLREGRVSFLDFFLRRELGYMSKLARGMLPEPGQEPIQKPWLAAVDSFAIGGGMQLLLVMDWVIAADDAYFSLPAASEGIVPGVANLRLGRLAGTRLAHQIILGGRKIYASSAEGAAFCDEVVPSAGLDAAIEAAVRALDHPAVRANRVMLALAEEPEEPFRAYLAEFAVVQARRIYSQDVITSVNCFGSTTDRKN